MNQREQKQKKNNPICDACSLEIKGRATHHNKKVFCDDVCKEDYESRQ